MRTAEQLPRRAQIRRYLWLALGLSAMPARCTGDYRSQVSGNGFQSRLGANN